VTGGAAAGISRAEADQKAAHNYRYKPGTGQRGPAKKPRTYSPQVPRQFSRVRELLQTDTEAAFGGDPAAFSKDEVIVAYPFTEAIAVQRLAYELYLDNVPLIPRIMTEWAHHAHRHRFPSRSSHRHAFFR